MVYALIVQPDAIKAMNKIPEPSRARIARQLESLARLPRPPGAIKLRGPLELYRLRVGNYRVIYSIHDEVLEVVVVRVGSRGDVYRRLKR